MTSEVAGDQVTALTRGLLFHEGQSGVESGLELPREHRMTRNSGKSAIRLVKSHSLVTNSPTRCMLRLPRLALAQVGRL
jgi:hypothetical protein